MKKFLTLTLDLAAWVLCGLFDLFVCLIPIAIHAAMVAAILWAVSSGK